MLFLKTNLITTLLYIVKTLFFILTFCVPFLAAAQERTALSGKVTSVAEDLEGIYVINKNTEESAATGNGGYFTILARSNDTLIFSSIQFEARQVVLVESDFTADIFLISLEPAVHRLEEVRIVDYRHINAESLGLVPKGQKQYTHAEKKLATASSGKMNPMGLDPLINGISGRTAMLKAAAEAAKKEEIIEKISYIYSEEDIAEKLSIPIEYVKGFLFYVAEHKYLAKAIEEKNTTLAKFLLDGLALKYLELLQE